MLMGIRESTFIMPRGGGGMKMLRGGALKYFLALKGGGGYEISRYTEGGGALKTFQSFGPAGDWTPTNIYFFILFILHQHCHNALAELAFTFH